MKFILENRIYSFPFLSGPNDAPFRIRYTESEGLILTSPDEVDEFLRGEPTGRKTIQWTDDLTLATGEDARKLWEVIRRVIVAEQLGMEVGPFLENVEAHDRAVEAARGLAIEEQRIRVESTEKRLEVIQGKTLAQIQQMESLERAVQESGRAGNRGGLFIVPPGGGTN